MKHPNPASRFGVIALASLALLQCRCESESKEEFETSDKVSVTVGSARVGSIRDRLTVTGTVKPASGAELLVTAPQSARLVEMPKSEGDHVRKRDLLVRFEI